MRNLLATVLTCLVALSIASAQPQYVRGPKGGCYEVTKTGGKKSVERGLCASLPASAKQEKAPEAPAAAKQSTQTEPAKATKPPAPAAPSVSAKQTPAAPAGQAPAVPTRSTTKGDKTYVTGPKGGCYYVTGSGRKQYVDRSMCK